MGRTTKSGKTGRFGTRYGSTVRKRVKEIEKKQSKKHKCPSCASKKVKRIAVAIWKCQFCGHKFAGGAYTPSTPVGKTALRTTNRLQSNK